MVDNQSNNSISNIPNIKAKYSSYIPTLNSSGFFSLSPNKLSKKNNWSISIKGLSAHEIYQKIKEGCILGSCYECEGEENENLINPYLTVDQRGNLKTIYAHCFCCEGERKVLYSIEFKKLAEAVLNHQTNLDKEKKENDNQL